MLYAAPRRRQLLLASGLGPSAASLAFLSRTSGLDALHAAAYQALIDGLVRDGLWPKLDALYVFATQDSTTALLNLVSTSFTGVVHGAPAFAADRGYTGVDGSTTVYIDTTFNPTTAAAPSYTRNGAHVGAWANTNITSSVSGGILVGAFTGTGAAPDTILYAKYSDGNSYFRVNDNVNSGGVANANAIGHYVATRSGASVQQGYKNAVDQGVVSQASGAIPNATIGVLAGIKAAGGVISGSAAQVSAVSIGGSLCSADVASLYARLRTYMTTVGVP